MNKRITSLLLCFVMVFVMLATAVPVFAVTGKTTTFTVTADKTEASPGDTINYTVKLGAVQGILSIVFELSFPEGLTYVEGTGKTVDGLDKILNNAEYAKFTEETKVFVVQTMAGYTSATDTTLMTFQCKVKDGATGTQKVTLFVEDEDNIFDTDEDNIAFTISNPTVTIVPAPKPATGVTLNKSTTTIYTGNSETLIATVSPSDTTDTLTWESNQTSVATVSNTGKVTAVAPGTAVITAKAGSKSATCTVTVENAPCTHANISTITAKPSTCKDKGWDTYKKCDHCDQLFDTNTNKISDIPYRSLADHKGGTATCKDRAICSECEQPYGNLANHDYTAQTKNSDTLKTAGTCKDNAVYYYSCSVCGKVEKNTSHTFNGDKNLGNHIAGTYLVGQKEANCKEEGYTGDVYCLDCLTKIEDGRPINKSAHNPASVWSHDDTNHWKNCTATGCGVLIESTKAPHTSTGENVANCQHKAVCDTCRELYGELGDHDWASATCTAPKTCTVCFETEGDALGHTEGTDWKSDADNHWHICTVAGCGVVIDSSKTTHTFEWKTDKEATATEKGSKHEECTICGYKKTAVEISATGTATEPTTPSDSTNQNKPTTPNESTKSDNTTKPENSDSPKTGDNNTLNLLIALFFVSGVAVTGTTVFSRKRRNTR